MSGNYQKRRCEQCNTWTTRKVFQCESCGAIMDKATHKARLSLIEDLRKQRQKREAEDALPPVRRGFRKFLRVLETIYLAIISFIAWLLFWIGG
jgi:hypothetical protein